jgi:HAD superfamily hydrolase (TIGR01509 family)
MTIEAILFDMDGTLVDSEGLHFAATVSVLSAAGISATADLARGMTGLSGRDCHALLRQTLGYDAGFEDYNAAKHDAYLKGAPSLQRRAGVDAVLAHVAEEGLSFAIVSNSDRLIVDANLRAVGLARAGAITVSRNDVREGKPSPEPFLRAAFLLGVSPDQCLVVEDSLPGAIAAHAAGMQVIGWPEPHRPDLRFPEGTHLAPPQDLLPTLKALTGAAPSF